MLVGCLEELGLRRLSQLLRGVEVLRTVVDCVLEQSVYKVSIFLAALAARHQVRPRNLPELILVGSIHIVRAVARPVDQQRGALLR